MWRGLRYYHSRCREISRIVVRCSLCHLWRVLLQVILLPLWHAEWVAFKLPHLTRYYCYTMIPCSSTALNDSRPIPTAAVQKSVKNSRVNLSSMVLCQHETISLVDRGAFSCELDIFPVYYMIHVKCKQRRFGVFRWNGISNAKYLTSNYCIRMAILKSVHYVSYWRRKWHTYSYSV